MVHHIDCMANLYEIMAQHELRWLTRVMMANSHDKMVQHIDSCWLIRKKNNGLEH